MDRLIAIALLAFAGFAVAVGQIQLPCNSILRTFLSLSVYFEHCECTYSSNYTEIIPYNLSDAIPVQVPRNQCESGIAVPGRGFREAIDGYECNTSLCYECAGKWEEIYICGQTFEEKLKGNFHIGSVGQNTGTPQCRRRRKRFLIATGFPPTSRPTDDIIILEQTPTINVTILNQTPFLYIYNIIGCRGRRQICSSTDVCQEIGKRSVKEAIEEEMQFSEESLQIEPKPLPVDPVPFDFAKHGARYRRDHTHCEPDDTVHILFILDTSGSIGRSNFELMTEALSKLVHRFCNPIKIAVMTFNHDRKIEFCFNCFGSSCTGRSQAKLAMSNITYRSGGTHTGEATQCVCSNMLTSQCGFPDLSQGTRCLDVIYVTDGLSNGALNVCNEIECIYGLENTDVNVFAFGIGNFRNTRGLEELKCITRDDITQVELSNSIFLLDSFNSLSEKVTALVNGFELSPDYSVCFTDSRGADGLLPKACVP